MELKTETEFKKFVELLDSTSNNETYVDDDGYTCIRLNGGEDRSISNMFETLFVSPSTGHPMMTNIYAFNRTSPYIILPGDEDSFGWVSAFIRNKKTRVIYYVY